MKRLLFFITALVFGVALMAQKPETFKVTSKLVTNLYKEKGVRKAKVDLTLEADKKLAKAEILDSVNAIVQTSEIGGKKKAVVDVSPYADGLHKIAVYSESGAKQIFMIKRIAYSK